MSHTLLNIFPRTPYIQNNNFNSSEVYVSREFAQQAINETKTIDVSIKLDGSNCRIFYDGENDLVIGNRTKILKKAYIKKDTPAKLQFRPIWNWVYDHKHQFKTLARMLKYTPLIYAEWLYAVHTIEYTELPSLLMPFDILLEGLFLDPLLTRVVLTDCGFHVPPKVEINNSVTIEELEILANGEQVFGGMREGIYIKLGNGEYLTHRFKIVRDDFKPRDDFNSSEMCLNSVKRTK